jgi:putative ABC transport system permease protein
VYNGKKHSALNFSCQANFAEVMGMHLVAGRMLDMKNQDDTINSVIVNEALVNDLGLTNKAAMGMKLERYSSKAKYAPVIVGVVSNYNLLPVKEKIVPTLFRQKNTYEPSIAYVRIRAGNPARVLRSLRTAWQKVSDNAMFDYSFLDEDLNARYRAETRLSGITTYAACICIFLASLGLGGIAFISSESRTKELIIRRVFGGSRFDMLYLLAKDLLGLVLTAFVVATPLSWYFLHRWLQGYAFRIQISGWIFIITGIGMLLFTFLVLSATVAKLAFLSPARGLRTE